jgi:hypothetical protein
MTYAFSERTRLGAGLSESLAPNGAGALSKSDTAAATLLHEFSERLTGRLGASFQRTAFPGAFDTSHDSDTLQGQVGFSYRLAERWKVEAGYVYTRASYSQNLGEPKSNLVFLSIGYNWPGASFTGWIGRLPEIQGFVGAAPLMLPEGSLRPPTSVSPPSSPFDRFALP